MDCCSSSNYLDYRHHSMNGNSFCYPYSPNMLRSASPYPLTAGGRYGSSDYRSSPLGGYHHHHGGYDSSGGYDKYYGSYHHAPPPSASYQAGYYGNYPSSYRDFGSYGHYYHQSQSPYARGAGTSGGTSHEYGGASSSAGSYLYPGRHYPASSLAHAAFSSSRESAYYHAQREHHHQQQQYSSFANYGHLPTPYRNGVVPGTAHEHPGGKSHHSQPSHQQQPYPPQQPFAASHNERALSGSGVGEGQTTTPAGQPSPSSSALFGAQNGYSSPSSDYTPLPTSSYSSGDSPQHPLAAAGGGQHDADERDAPTTPTPTTALLGATAAAAGEFPHGTKDNRMRKPKERKLHRGYGTGGSGRSSRASSPAAANGLSGSNGAAAATRMKSLDALTNLCWPEEDQFPGRMRKYSTANGLKAKDGSNGRKDGNELENGATASPSRTAAGPARRTKKQTPSGGSRQSKETKSSADSREKQTNGASPPTTAPAIETKHLTPLPGFQQAFGSTEIGKFSEVFFNSSPTSANHSPPDHHNQHHLHHHHPLQLQEQHQRQQQTQQSQQVPSQSNGAMQQLVMDSLNAYESDVDTLSPSQAWDSSGPGGGGGPGDGGGDPRYNLPIGTTFHPSYYESSSYSDHAVDSPLGNYFSEMTCNEFVN